jgi:kynureninase
MNPRDGATITREMARRMDLADPLAGLRKRFIVDDENALYMDGNSLGRQPTDAAAQVAKALEAWRSDLIIAWREWIRVPGRLGDLIAQSVVEARPGEITVGDSTSVNLYKAAAAALHAQPDRRTIITSDDNFPTDLYVLQALAARLSLNLKVLPADSVSGLQTSVLRAAVDTETALVCLSHTVRARFSI